MLAVRVFGEMEFWFALIKVTMIVMLIVGGLVVILFGVGNLGATAGFSNLFSHGGFLPFGILGVLLTFQMVMFGFQGVELIGVTAGEAENPEVVLPSATNSIIYRILISWRPCFQSSRQRAWPFMSRQYGSPCSASLTSA